jgi:hypothetical protein
LSVAASVAAVVSIERLEQHVGRPVTAQIAGLVRCSQRRGACSASAAVNNRRPPFCPRVLLGSPVSVVARIRSSERL